MTPPPPAVVTTTPPAASTDPAWYQALTIDALVDSYYQLNFSQMDTETLLGPALRQFDTAANSFSLNYAKVGLGFSLNPVAFRIDLGYGHAGQIINAASAGSSSAIFPTSTLTPGLYGSAFFLQQAYASLTLGSMLTVDFGKFMTTAGAEVIEANKNWLYSRSMLFFTMPLVHTGVRANLKINDMIALQGSVVNGINNDPDNNGEKTFGLSAAITPLPTTSMYLTGYFGKEGPQGGMEGDTKITVDFVAAHNVSDQLGVNLNVDYVKLGPTNLVGAALMARFLAAEHLSLAGRFEYLSDKGVFVVPAAANGNRTPFFEGTLMVGAPFAKRFEARLEFRGDFAGNDQLVFNGKDKQFTGTLAFLAWL